MTKQIQVSDEVYERLKSLADGDKRPMGMQIDWLMERYWENIEGNDMDRAMSPAIKQPPVKIEELIRPETQLLPEIKKSPLANARNKGTILATIRKVEAQLKEDLEFCQDPETRARLEADAKHDLDILWAEYREE